MSYHIVSIDAPRCSVGCRDGQLTCKTDGLERRVPLEDVASAIVTSFSASIHSELLLEAARCGVAIVICRAFRPTSIVLPANRSSDTLLTRAQVHLPAREASALWQRTVDAKCQNQFLVAKVLSPGDARLRHLEETAFGRKPHKEAICSKAFWQIFGTALKDETFSRSRRTGGLNALLNYGYAVLLSTTLQKLFAVGLDPTFGISHVARERSTPLAYDMMEPFRPCVDWRVVQWVRQNPDVARWEVTTEFRRWVTAFPIERVEHLGLSLEVQGCIEGVIRGFRRAILENRPAVYRPWRPKPGGWPTVTSPSKE